MLMLGLPQVLSVLSNMLIPSPWVWMSQFTFCGNCSSENMTNESVTFTNYTWRAQSCVIPNSIIWINVNTFLILIPLFKLIKKSCFVHILIGGLESPSHTNHTNFCLTVTTTYALYTRINWLITESPSNTTLYTYTNLSLTVNYYSAR
jgi:hypothetical protein